MSVLRKLPSPQIRWVIRRLRSGEVIAGLKTPSRHCTVLQSWSTTLHSPSASHSPHPQSAGHGAQMDAHLQNSGALLSKFKQMVKPRCRADQLNPDHIDSLTSNLVKRYLTIIDLARLSTSAPNHDDDDDMNGDDASEAAQTDRNGADLGTAAVNAFRIEVETAGLIKAAEDILALTRQMKELWLFGSLEDRDDGAAANKLEKKMDEDARAVGRMLAGLLKRQGQAPTGVVEQGAENDGMPVLKEEKEEEGEDPDVSIDSPLSNACPYAARVTIPRRASSLRHASPRLSSMPSDYTITIRHGMLEPLPP
ncbi:hypothetical protein MRB53_037927 [Persea americana]|nr:hypothetical protein MRB53_037927 [Persea americana]